MTEQYLYTSGKKTTTIFTGTFPVTEKGKKVKTTRERQAERALKLSLRNNPPKRPNAQLKRRQRRLAARLANKPWVSLVKAAQDATGALVGLGGTVIEVRAGYEKMNRDELRALCAEADIKTTTKMKKADLIDLLVG